MSKTHPTDDFRATVLAVSPDADDPKVVQSALEGWSVRRAQTCSEALDILRSSSCNVILCEKDLPDGGWRDVLRGLRDVRDAPPVVVMSRVADDDLWAEVLRDGAFDLLSKPLDGNEVHRVLPTACERGVQHHTATA